MPKYIDTHCHVNFKIYEKDKDEVIRRALENDTWLINVGTQIDTSKSAVDLANKYESGVYAIVGLHPIHTEASFYDEEELGNEGKEFTSRGEIFDKEKYKELAKNEKVVAIGECGLDYFHLGDETIEKQKAAFISQIELANELDLPLMLHIRNGSMGSSQALERNAYFDVYELLKKYSTRDIKGVSHFFAGSVEDMQRFISIGVYVSFAGPVTYKPNLKICDYEKVIKETPLDMMLTDTDSPYVAPVPHRGERNEPLYVREIVKKIANIKGLSEEDVAEKIVKNVKKLFDI